MVCGALERLAALKESLRRALQQRSLPGNDSREVGLVLGKQRNIPERGWLDEPLVAQDCRTDQQRISSQCRKALIRRIAVTGGSERQHLPQRLSRVSQRVREAVSGRPEVRSEERRVGKEARSR